MKLSRCLIGNGDGPSLIHDHEVLCFLRCGGLLQICKCGGYVLNLPEAVTEMICGAQSQKLREASIKSSDRSKLVKKDPGRELEHLTNLLQVIRTLASVIADD
jgi:hypothetical protein